jgi:hypothetical protein
MTAIVPEPAAGGLAVACLSTLLVLHRVKRRRQGGTAG